MTCVWVGHCVVRGAWGKVTELWFGAARFLGVMSCLHQIFVTCGQQKKHNVSSVPSGLVVRRPQAIPGFEVEATILKKSRSDSEMVKDRVRGVDGFQTKILCFHGYFFQTNP